jgi:hypothetical protein
LIIRIAIPKDLFIFIKNKIMEFTQNFLNTDNIKVDGHYVHLFDANNNVLEMFIGEEVRNAVWADDNQLLVTLENGSVRLYQDQINYINI